MTDELTRSAPGPSLPWTAVAVKTPGLVTRNIADETVVVPIKGHLAQLQNLYILTPVANHLWTQIDGVKDLRALHASILDSYDVDEGQARTDLFEFVHSMLDSGLIHLRESGEEVAAR